jgi:hypothetical protein
VIQRTAFLQKRRQQRRLDLVGLILEVPKNHPLQGRRLVRRYQLIQLLFKYLPQPLPRRGTRSMSPHLNTSIP